MLKERPSRHHEVVIVLGELMTGGLYGWGLALIPDGRAPLPFPTESAVAGVIDIARSSNRQGR